MPDASNDLFLSALKSDDVAGAVQALDGSRQVTERFHFGRTALHVAAENGATACVRMLVGRGASIEAHDGAGHSPLIAALGTGHAKTASVLIEAGALVAYGHTPDDTPPIREQLRRDYEAVSAASREAHPDIYRVLDDASLDLDREAFQAELMDSFVSTAIAPKEVHAIHHCANLKTLQLLAHLPSVKFDLHDGAGYWPLKSFAEKGDSEAVDWLLRHGASPDFTSTGETALHSAVADDSLECARLLLAAGANPNQQDVDGCVAMWRVASDAMLDLLLAHGADPTIGDQCDFKPSHWVKEPKLKSRLLALEREFKKRKRK